MYSAPSHYLYEIFEEEIEIKEEWSKFWVPQYGNKDYYMSFAEMTDTDPITTEMKLKDVLLHTYARMIRAIPSRHVTLEESEIQSSETKVDGIDLTDNARVYPATVEGWISDTHVKLDLAKAIKSEDLPAKTNFLIRIRKWDLERPVDDKKKQENYRLYQAIMASRYDKMRAKKPGTSNWYMTFPRSSVLKD
jgi:hypothetical protein